MMACSEFPARLTDRRSCSADELLFFDRLLDWLDEVYQFSMIK